MKTLALCLVLSIIAVAQATDDMQMATIVSFEKLANSQQHPENNDRYKMSLRLGETLYLCETTGPVREFMDWTINKELPAKLEGKVLQVKNFDGKILDLRITGKKKPK
jgi:hypothetical protein